MTTNNGWEFNGQFEALVRSLGIKHKRITVGNSQANRQVKRTIRTVKDAIRRMLTSRSSTY